MRSTSNATLDFLASTAHNATESSDFVRRASSSYRTPVDYGQGGGLAGNLQRVAALIAAEMPTRLYYVTYQGNNFDTHVQQADLHSRLLMYTADALRGFIEDVERLGRGDDVAVMIFTEFGRRVEENGSLGTDHGTATPMFIAGKGVKGGLYGRPPSLTDLDDGNLKMTTDFRRVYATMIDEWLGCQRDAGDPQGPVRHVERVRVDRGGHLREHVHTKVTEALSDPVRIVPGAVAALSRVSLVADVVSAQAPQGGGPGGRGAAAGQTVEKIRELKPNLYMITGAGANTLVRVTPEGLIVVDTKLASDENYKRLMEEIASVSKLPVKYVLNTHHHPDHVGNNQKFIDAGAQVVGLDALKTTHDQRSADQGHSRDRRRSRLRKTMCSGSVVPSSRLTRSVAGTPVTTRWCISRTPRS